MKRRVKWAGPPPKHDTRFKDEAGYVVKTDLSKRLIAHIMRDPARSIATSLLLTALASVAINALFLQAIKHPATLFDVSVTPVLPDTKPEIVSIPAPVPVPMPRSQAFSTPPDVTNGSALLSTILSGTAEDTTGFVPAPVQKPDTIGDLITNVLPKPSPAPPPNKTVLAAQRALVKLGYAVKADGISGGTTRQAVERFERDNRLPVKGDLTPKLLRELSVASGIVIE